MTLKAIKFLKIAFGELPRTIKNWTEFYACVGRIGIFTEVIRWLGLSISVCILDNKKKITQRCTCKMYVHTRCTCPISYATWILQTFYINVDRKHDHYHYVYVYNMWEFMFVLNYPRLKTVTSVICTSNLNLSRHKNAHTQYIMKNMKIYCLKLIWMLLL